MELSEWCKKVSKLAGEYALFNMRANNAEREHRANAQSLRMRAEEKFDLLILAIKES